MCSPLVGRLDIVLYSGEIKLLLFSFVFNFPFKDNDLQLENISHSRERMESKKGEALVRDPLVTLSDSVL